MSRAAPLESPQGLSRYVHDIRKYPILTVEEELMLARRWRKEQDLPAARQLVSAHLRLVAKIANGYRNYGLPLDELIGEGNVGMMQAVERFDPDCGFRLATYAIWWIRGAIQNYVLRNLSLVRMGTTAAQKKLFFSLRRLKGEMVAIEDGDLNPEQVATIADALEVPEQEVVTMNRRLATRDQSLNAPLRSESDSEWQDWLADEADSPETMVVESEELSGRKALLAVALETLNERERHIVSERRLKEQPTTLEQLSEYYGVSRERVRQLEERAFVKLQRAMKGQIAARRPRAAGKPPSPTRNSMHGSHDRRLRAQAAAWAARAFYGAASRQAGNAN